MLRNAVISIFDIDIFMAVNAHLVIKWLSYNIIMPAYQCWLLSSSGPKNQFLCQVCFSEHELLYIILCIRY